MRIVSWGLVGAGDIVRKRVLPAILALDNSEPLAIVRGRSEKAQEFAAANGIERAYGTLEELLADGEIDAVYIASPVDLHAEQAIAAANAGKHILCEKPMALTAEACREMLTAARANGVRLGVAYYRRFYPVVRRLKDAIAGGAIGRPVYASVSAFERFNPAPDDPRRWFLDKARSGGGPMMDFGCHRIEVLLNILGPIERVEAINANVVYDRQVEDTSVALLKFDSGATVCLAVSHAASESRDSIEIFGSEGSIFIPSLNRGDMVIRTDKNELIERHPPPANFHEPLIEDFAEAVLEDREPIIPGEVGLEVAIVEDKIYNRE